jgi:hypothetical protein
MPDNSNNLPILSQLDESERGDIITDEELEEIGVAYGSKARYEQAMRSIAERLSPAQVGRRAYVPVGDGRKGPRIKAGTSTVPVGDLPKVKRINIVGKVIGSAGDAAQLFSVFRDPRIEIFNVAYFSRYGKVLAHTAWTCGLPSLSPSVYSYTLDDGFSRIQNTLEHLGASHIWIAHNHPTGNPNPSAQDEIVTEKYRSYFKEKFAGHIILDHKEYSLFESDFFNNRSFKTHSFKEPVKKLISKRLEDTASASNPEDIAKIFKKVFSINENVTAHAILDHKNRVVSWLYGGDNYSSELKEYIRAAGGTSVVTLTNNDTLYGKYCSRADQSLSTENNVLLDVILVNRWTGNVIKSHVKEDLYRGATWQHFEDKKLHYVVNNLSNKRELDLFQPPASLDTNVKEENMSGIFKSFYEDRSNKRELDLFQPPASLDTNVKKENMSGIFKSFYEVRYQIDTKNKVRASDIIMLSTNGNKPENKFSKHLPYIQYSEFFNISDEPIAYRKMQAWQTPIPEMTETQKEHFRSIAELFTKNNYIQADIVQFTTPSLPRGDINIKENTMSDENENSAVEQDTAAEKNFSPRDLAFRDATWQRKVIVDSLKNGSSPCLPGSDGYADTKPAVNLVNGHIYQGETQLYLKDHQKQHGFPTAEYATLTQINRAKEDNPSLYIIKGQKGVSVYFSEKTDEGEYIDKSTRLFNIAQLNRPQLFVKWAEEERIANYGRNLEYQRQLHGDAYKPPEGKEKTAVSEVVCNSTEPAKYLGQYLAAVSMGAQFKASPEQGKEFAQKMVDSLYEKSIIAKSGEKQGEYVTDPFKLSKIGREANQHCKETIKELSNGLKPAQEQKQEQQQEQSRGIGR